MRGRSLLSLFLTLVSINLVSAAYYGNFSLESLLSSIDPSTMVLGVIFIISSLLINTALKRVGVFRDSTNIAGVISITLAVFIIWGVNRSGIDYYSFFNGILSFIPNEMLEIVWPILFSIGTGLLFWKFKKNALLFLGILLIAGSFFAYESGILQVIGLILILLWIILWWMGRGKVTFYPNQENGYIPQNRPPRDNSNNGWLGRKAVNLGKKGFGAAKNIGQEWTRRDQAMREKMATQQTTQREQQAQQQQTAQRAQQQKAVSKQQQKAVSKQQQKIVKDKVYWRNRGIKLNRILTKLSTRNPSDPKIAKFNKELMRVNAEIKKINSQR